MYWLLEVPAVQSAFSLSHAKLSELRSTSDNFSTSTTKPVRTRGYFRQLFPFFCQTCPNLTLLRTAFLLLTPNLSKIGSTLDSFSSSHTKPVLTRGCFGQLFPFFHQTCPNWTLLRSAFPILPPNLYELEATLDSFSSSHTKPVRTGGYFGQLFLFSHQTCPNWRLLWTAFPLLPSKLSKHKAASDSFSFSSVKPVQNQPNWDNFFTSST
jgi:hypothetical protein